MLIIFRPEMNPGSRLNVDFFYQQINARDPTVPAEYERNGGIIKSKLRVYRTTWKG